MQVRLRYINKYDILIFGSFVFLSYRYLVPNSNLIVAYGGLAICSALAGLFLLLNGTVKISSMFPLICFDVAALFASLYNHNTSLVEIVIMLSFQLIGMTLYLKQKTYSVVWLFSVLYYIYLFINIMRGIDPNTIFYLTSRNYISVFALFFLALYIFNKEKNGGKVKIWFFLLNIFVCLWAQGRGGILASGIAIVGFIVFSSDFIRLPRLLKISFMLICAMGIVFLYYDAITNKISVAMLAEGRIGVWSRYLTNATNNILDFILGVKNYYLTTDILRMRHLHNSFINLHFYFGIIPIIIFFILSMKIGIVIKKEKRYTLLVICVALFVRMFTDIMAFSGIFDILWSYMFLFYLNNKSIDNKMIC